MNLLNKAHCVFMLAILLCMSYACTLNADQTASFRNQRGSTMVITWHGDPKETGSLSGTFTTAVGSPSSIGVAQPIMGFFNGNAIALTVNYPNVTKVVAMAGHLINHGDELSMLWIVTEQANDPVKKNWDSNRIGADRYERYE